MIHRKLALLIAIFIFLTIGISPALSVPAAPGIHTLQQKDGSKFNAKLWGDEWNNGFETLDGYTVILNETSKNWVFAGRSTDGKLVMSDKIVGKDVPSGFQKHLRGIKANISTGINRISSISSLPQSATTPSNGTIGLPVITIKFTDQNNIYSTTDFEHLLFNSVVGSKSMRDYYREVSYGNLTLTSGSMGVRGWYVSNNNHAYYGYANGFERAAMLVKEAVQKADAAGFDFSSYDYNQDGYVDGVVIIHSGEGREASGNSSDVWSHKWSLSDGGYVTNDGVIVWDYTIQPEILWGGQQTVGVFAHESGHLLGLPDLYDTDYSSAGVGLWSLMAGGTWNGIVQQGDTPAQLDAWSKSLLGWTTPIKVTKSKFTQINQTETNSEVYKLLDNPNGASDWSYGGTGEYFLVENRRKIGFDSALPGEGLLIWHIDESMGGNSIDTHRLVDLEEADGNDIPSESTDPWYSSTGFTESTIPNSNLYNGSSTYVRVTNISASASIMTADLNVATVHNINKGTNYTTIQEAIDDSSPGDEIHVDSGIYPENVNVIKRLTLRGIGMPVVDAGGSGIAITLVADGIRLEGFTATNGSKGIEVTSNNNILQGNNASNNDYGIYVLESSNNTLNGNSANSNYLIGITLFGSNHTFISNYVINNYNLGFNLFTDGTNKIYNNIFNNLYGNVEVQTVCCGPVMDMWNITKTPGPNIVGGPFLGGNFWANPDGTGFSQKCPDTDGDGICNSAYINGIRIIDYLPLAVPAGPVHNINKDTNYTKIQEAIDDASPGDEIHVDTGTYYENVNVNKQLTLRGIGMPVVDARGSGSAITLAADGIRLEGFTATGGGPTWGDAGITITSENNMLIENNASYNSGVYGYGIFMVESNNNTLIGNNANYNYGPEGGYGIYLLSSSNNTLIGNNVNYNNGDLSSYGIFLYGNNNTLIGNNASNNGNLYCCGTGIYLYESSNNKIYNNIFNNYNNLGFYGSNVNTWNITKTPGTNIVGGSYLGGNFWANPDGTGFSQTCTDADSDGICDSAYKLDNNNTDYLPLARNVYTEINSCTKISSPGQYVLTQNIINSGVTGCINITSSDVIFDGAGYTIDGNGLTNYGLYANNVNHITVRNLVAQDWNSRAVNIVNSNNNYFSNITVKSGNYDGFYLQNSNNNLLRTIKTFNTGDVGFVFENSYGNDLKDSVFQNNAWEDFDIYLTGGVSGCNNKVGNVSLTKYQLYYYNESVNLKDINAGAIYLCNADNSTVTNATVAANGQNSISNYYVDNVTYTNITTSGLKEAIFFKFSANNNISNILMKDGWSGISYSTNTTNTNYKNATIYNMTDRAVRIYAGASRNTISDSKIYNNSVGIYLNTAGKYGPNKIYNTYLNNIKNIEWGVPDFFGDGTVYPNYWNTTKQPVMNIMGGPNLGGNFWGYPNGTGFSQTCTDAGGDGICDLAYTLKSNNIDYLPLLLPSIPSITVISPNGGEDWTQGSTQVIRWNYKVSPGPNVMIELLKNGVLNSVLTSSTSTGSSGSGSYDWLIDPAQTSDADYKIKITSTADPAYTDTSDNNFAISEPSFNLIKNGGFESGKNNWTFYSNVAGSFNIVSPGYEGNNAAMIKLDSIGTNMQFYQYLIPMEPNTRYRLSFMAYSTYGDDVVVKLIKHAGSTPYAPDFPVDLGTNWQRFSTEFISSGSAMNDARLMFWFVNVGAKAGEAYYIDDVRLEKVSSPITECTTISSPGKYVLTQNIINSNVESCINIISSDVIFDGAGYTIDGNGLTNYGLSVKNVNRVTVKNLVVQDWNTRSVNIVNSNNNNFSNITVKSGSFDGFYLQNSNNNILRNITALNTGNVGFTFDSSQGNDLKDAIFQNNSWEDFDIYLNGGVSGCNNEVRNVALTKYPLYYYNNSINIKDIYAGAIYLCNADNSRITNATIAANGQSSISNYYVENVTYTNITTSGLKEAIFFKYSENNNITNILMKDGWSGISYSTNTTNTNYKNATIYNMTGRAIRIYAGASRNTISDSKIYNSSVGIYLNTAGKYGPNKIYNSFFNNTQNIEWGIADFFGDGSVYPNSWNVTKQPGKNIMGGPNLGGNFWGYPNGTGFSQTCVDGNNDGICDSTYSLKSNNIDYLPLAYNAAVGSVHNINKGTNYATIQAAINDANPGNEIHVDSGSYYENVNVNKQLILRGIGMPVVDAMGSGSAIMFSSDGITLEGFTATNASTGISGSFSGSNIKDNQIISNYGSGIGVLGGYNTISGNHIISNYGDGISISGTENTIKNNEIRSNANGIGLDISNNSVIGNNITYNGDGIYLVYDSKKMNISGNNIDFNSNGIHFPGDNHESLVENNYIRWNTETGISIDGYESGHWNTIYNNYFNNNINTFIYGNNYGFVNYWNITKTPGTNIIGGPNLGGNFWAHPNGTGFSQTCTDADGDGICDSAFVIDGNNTDYLPLAYNATPDFTISASPLSQSIVQGSSTTYSISLTSLNGFNGAVSLSASGLPAGATASFSPGSITPTGTSTLDIQTLASTPNGSYPFTINGTGGGKTHNVTVTLVVSSQAGNIMVTTNNPGATFTITGPATYSGSGTSWSQSNAPVGTYSIAFGSISGFNTPSDTSETLSNGGTITFSGTYTPITPNGSNWSMDILANSTDTFGNLLNSKVNFGVNTIATDGYDGAPFDINAAPVSPTGFDLRFLEPGVSTGELKNDTKAPGTSKNWTLLAQAPKSRKINVTWVSGNIPPMLVMEIQELDPNTGLPIGSPIDMRSVNLISFTAGDFSNMQKGYLITASSQISHTISLSRGWNMISLPVNASNPSIGAIFGSNVTTVYGWTGTSYELSSELEPKRGYWALSSSNYDVTVTGTPVVDRDITLTRGWNMVGPVTNGVMVSSLPNVTTVYGWTGTSYTILDSTDTLTLTKGYWMLANAASTIQV